VKIYIENFGESEINIDSIRKYGLKADIVETEKVEEASAIVLAGDFGQFCCTSDAGSQAAAAWSRNSELPIFILVEGHDPSVVIEGDTKHIAVPKDLQELAMFLNFLDDPLAEKLHLLQQVSKLKTKLEKSEFEIWKEVKRQKLYNLLNFMGEPPQQEEEKFIPASDNPPEGYRGEVDSEKSLVVCKNGIWLRLPKTDRVPYIFKLIGTKKKRILEFVILPDRIYINLESSQKIPYSPDMDFRAYHDIIKSHTNYELPPVIAWECGVFPYADLRI